MVIIESSEYYTDNDAYVNNRNLERVIIGAYRWLSDHYEEGDEIFLFGTRRHHRDNNPSLSSA